MKKLLILIAVLVALYCSPAAKALTYQHCGQVIVSGNVATCSFTYGEGDVATLQTGGGLGVTGITTPTSSGCDANWIPVTAAPLSTLDHAEYYFQVMHGTGTCAVTETASGSGILGIQVVSVQGLPNYAQDVVGVPAVEGGGAACNVSGISSVASDALVAFTAGYETSFGGIAMIAAGWTQQIASENVSGNGMAMQGFSKTGGAAGTQTLASTNAGTGGTSSPTCDIFLIRTTAQPTFGFMQGAFAKSAASTSSVSLTLPYKSLAGDDIRIALQGVDSDNFVTMTIGSGPTCYKVASGWGTAGTVWTYDCKVLTNSSSPFTITASIGANLQMDMLVWEVAGLASSNWLASSTGQGAGGAGGTCPATLFSGPIELRETATYYLDAIVQSNFPPPTYAAGFFLRMADSYGYGGGAIILSALLDQTATVSGVTNFNATAAYTGELSGCGVGLWAWSNTSYADPVAVQTWGNDSGIPGSGGPYTRTAHINEPTTGCAMFVIAGASIPASSWTISSSPSLTWSLLKGGGAGDLFAIWGNFSLPSGVVDATVAPTGTTTVLETNGLKVCNLTGINSAVSATAAATSVGPISISTSSGAQYILASAIASGASSGTNITYSSAQLWPMKQWGNGDNISVQTYDYLTSTPGTYSISFSAAGSSSPSNMSGVMTNYITPPPPASQQPHVTVAGIESHLPRMGR